ncbi:MAG: hypothetical protein LBE47_02140 [Methanomassiliicoccaceae archaeon]|nr:hypothetical protein [Methanomassiliicoccaceae archaeon]
MTSMSLRTTIVCVRKGEFDQAVRSAHPGIGSGCYRMYENTEAPRIFITGLSVLLSAY